MERKGLKAAFSTAFQVYEARRVYQEKEAQLEEPGEAWVMNSGCVSCETVDCGVLDGDQC